MPINPLLEATATGAMENLGTVFTWLTTHVGDLITVITGNPILLLGVGFTATGAVIGLGHRLIRG